MTRVFGALVLAIPCAAHAESAATTFTTPTVSVPVEIGGGTEGFLVGARPEFVLAHLTEPPDYRQSSHGFGFGVAGEANRIGGKTTVGAALTFVRFVSYHRFASSIGVYDRVGHACGASASVFAGVRPVILARPFDYHLGFRVTGRTDLSGANASSVELAVQIDTLFAPELAKAMVMGLFGQRG